MKRAILIIGVILMGLTLRAQSVTYTCRYWFDKSDTQVATTEFTGSLWEEELDVGTLTYGLHTLHLQVMDASMNWSAPESFLFLKLDEPSGLDCHYWFDQDFEGKQVTAFNSSLLLDVDALDLGMHTLHILLKGTEYTSTESYLFLKADTPEQIESYTCHYWFDQDFANAQSTDFGDGNLLLNVTDLTDGIHTLHLTLEGTTLTSTESYLFAKVAVEDGEDVTYRYWFDRDLANSETFVLTDGIMLLDVSALDNGLHSLHLMKEGSSNSSTESYLFVKIPVEDPEAGMQYHCWFDQDYNTVQTGEVGNGVFLVNVGALTVGEHELVLQFDDGNRYSPETYTFYRMPMVTVSINPVNAGLATSSVVDDTICTLNAEPNVGYDFANWTQNGEVVSADPNYTFNLTEDAEFVANFVLKSYDITATANPADGGTIEGDGVHFHFSTCTLTATANTGYHFLSWTQDGVVVSESETFSFEVEGPASYVANFEVNSYEITATVNPNNVGTVEGMGTYEHFSTCTLTATPNTGYHFVNWTMNGQVVSSTAAYSFTVTGEGAYVANFELNSYEIAVTADPTEGGTVTGGGTYEHFSECTLTATANDAYAFVNWTLDGEIVSTNAVYTFIVTGPATYVANFSMNTYEILAIADPEEGGTVEGSGVYAQGVTAVLTATPAEGYHFLNWTDMSGEVVSSDETYSLTVTEFAEFVAHFELNTYEIIAIANPEDGGIVEGSGTYNHGETCTLEAIPNEGYLFINWTKGNEVVSDEPTISFTVTESAEYLANFELETYEISGNVSPHAGGTVDGFGYYAAGETCTLTAIPNEGYEFLYWMDFWGEIVSYAMEYSFTVTGDAMYYATFELGEYEVNAFADPEEGGTVDGAGFYTYGETATLTATPAEGYEFLYWLMNGETVSTELSYSFTVTDFAEFVAHFELNTYEIIATANPADGGTVEGDGTYNHGDTCTLVAMPNENHLFINWTKGNEVVSDEPTISFTVTESAEYLANFELETYEISGNVSPHAGGTVDGFGYYAAGETCTLTAIPNEGYEFLYWMDFWGEIVSYAMEYSFTVTGDAMYYATFELGEYEVNAFADPEEGGTVDGAGFYTYGETATLTATPAEGYEFLYWLMNGETVSSEPVYSFEVVEDVELLAVFSPMASLYYIEAIANPEEGGSVFGSSYYFEHDYCTLLAVANEGYEFVNWTKDGQVVSTLPEYVFEVLEDGFYVANFISTETHWTVDPSQYPDNMSITGIIQIDGEEQFSETLELGAFSNGECRGTAMTVYQPNLERYFVYLTVYGEDGDVINFRLFDHATGEEVDIDCESTIVFEMNAIIGDLMEPYVFNFVSAITQTSSFSNGWNWWSGYVELDGAGGMQDLQESLGTNGEMIKSQNNGYASYLAGFGWYGSLTSINNLSTYQVKTNSACTIELTGSPVNPADYPITLNSGWSWVGYPVTVNMSVAEALSGIQPLSGDMLKSQNNGYASYLEGFGWYGSLNTLQPGMGLMYKSNNGSAVTLVYPNGVARTDLKANQTAENNHWQPNLNAYADNMSVMAVIELNDEELRDANYELAAFANGVVRGSARLLYVEPIDRYYAFLTVAGDDVTELYFGLYNTETGEELVGADQTATYSVNAVLGNFAEPYVVSFRSTTGVDEWSRSLDIYPNPVYAGQTVSIGFSDAVTGEMQVEIVNALGAVVETRRTSSLHNITAPETAGVYTLRITIEGKGTCYRKLVVR